mgnify:CR=1 FL=1
MPSLVPDSDDWRVWACGSLCYGNPYGWRLMTYISRSDGSKQHHSMPQGDLKAHTGPDCWCGPELLSDDGVWAHHAVDLREDYELGLRQPH